MPLIRSFVVDSENVEYGQEDIIARYRYDTTRLRREGADSEPGGSTWHVEPVTACYEFRTRRRVPKLGRVTRPALKRRAFFLC